MAYVEYEVDEFLDSLPEIDTSAALNFSISLDELDNKSKETNKHHVKHYNIKRYEPTKELINMSYRLTLAEGSYQMGVTIKIVSKIRKGLITYNSAKKIAEHMHWDMDRVGILKNGN